MNLSAGWNLADRDIRQRGLVPPQALSACHGLIIGVGAIGRQVALQLAALGVPELTLFDEDIVGVENLAVQGYWAEDLGAPKVHATAEACRRINAQVQLTPVRERFKRSTASHRFTGKQTVIFSCVDSIATRRVIWEAVRNQAALFVDGRMSAEVIRVLAVAEPSLHTYYPGTLFAGAQAYVGSCTARSTIYTASIAAGLMIGQFTRWLRRLPTDSDLTLNLLAAELTAMSATPP
ncbi:MAG: ThiF family adenylyltransferase [Gemmataceae bacterium]|nr:ThiF family adenylyltransferase [Gemmataceae bacterium]